MTWQGRANPPDMGAGPFRAGHVCGLRIVKRSIPFLRRPRLLLAFSLGKHVA